MKKSRPTENTPYDTGISIIKSAVSLDEALSDMLKLEVSSLKKSVNNASVDDFTKLHSLLRNIISALILTSEKIQTGIELIDCNQKPDDNDEEN